MNVQKVCLEVEAIGVQVTILKCNDTIYQNAILQDPSAVTYKSNALTHWVSGSFNRGSGTCCTKTHGPCKIKVHVFDKIQTAKNVDDFICCAHKYWRSGGAAPVHIQAENIFIVDRYDLSRTGERIGIKINIVVSGRHLIVGDDSTRGGCPVGDIRPVAGAANPVVVGGGS